jgi:pimeloyl-ACP methyl ester carboxylesterase
MDRADGVERWETVLVDELLPHVRTTTGAGVGSAPTLVGGVSMGGMGSLRFAFKHPDRFAAVAACEPGIEASPRWEDATARDRIHRGPFALSEIYGDPADTELFTANHPLGILERNAAAIVASGLGIYLEVGDLDLLHLHQGTEALHRRMFDIGVPHEYRLVRFGDHIGPTLAPRITDALRFLGRHLAGPPEPPDPAGFADVIAEGEASAGFRRRERIGEIDVDILGEGPMVVLLPSLGRGPADFAVVAKALAVAGFRSVCPTPRAAPGATLHDLAADVAAVIEALGGPATVVGHAFGNRVARTVATDHPHVVRDVVLLACGGKVPPAPEHQAALLRCFDLALRPEDHLAAVASAFFAEGNDPAAWADGWDPELAKAQAAATRATPVEEWWSAGSAPLLVVQPEDDVIALRANADDVLGLLGDRAELVVIPRAGHALLPEQPGAVTTVLLRWLRRETGPLSR